MLASSDPGWMQGYFNTLVEILDQVGLKTNVGKMFGMVWRPCQASGTESESLYEQ